MPIPDDAEANPWAAPAAEVGLRPLEGEGMDAAGLGPLYARRTTVRLVGLGFLALALLEMLLAFVAGANSRQFWNLGKFGREQGLGGGSALDTALILTVMAAVFVILGVLHLALLAGLWRLARWARVATIGLALVYGLGTMLALPVVGDRDGGLGWATVVGAGLIGGFGNCGLALLLLLPRSRSLFAPGVAAALRTTPRPRRPFGRVALAFLAGLVLLALNLVLAAAVFAFYIHLFMLMDRN